MAQSFSKFVAGCAAVLIVLFAVACAGQPTQEQTTPPADTTSQVPAQEQAAPAPDQAAAPAEGAPVEGTAPAQGEAPAGEQPQN